MFKCYQIYIIIKSQCILFADLSSKIGVYGDNEIEFKITVKPESAKGFLKGQFFLRCKWILVVR